MTTGISKVTDEKASAFLRTDQRGFKPRKNGITEIRGSYYLRLAKRSLEDILETIGNYVDALKFTGGSFSLMPQRVLRELISSCHEHNVMASAGGFIEHVLMQGADAVNAYIKDCKQFGLDILEASSGFSTLPAGDWLRSVDNLQKAGLRAKGNETGAKSGKGEPKLPAFYTFFPELKKASHTRSTSNQSTVARRPWVGRELISNLSRCFTTRRPELKERVQKILLPADIRIDGDRRWDITVHNDQFYARVLRLGSLGLGESYMDAWWDCPALDQFFSRVLGAELDRNAPWTWRLMPQNLVATILNRQTRSRAKRVAEQHYDLGNELYQNMLDHRMVYTCARWAYASSLDEAQEAKLDFVCRKLALKPGMTLLDIGCGWGSLARFAAEKYGARVVGITLSQQQVELSQDRCKGLPIEIRLQDYREVTGTFDRIASLGMFEHVGYKNYRTFFEVTHRSLRPGGFLFLSTIGANHSVHATDPWIDKYIFPNSHPPSAAQITRAIEGSFLLEDWENWAPDYDRTVMAWFRNFHQYWRNLQAHYDQRFHRMWEYYLMVAAASFRSRKNQVWEILMSRQ
jgi:cyclopropane-fatty-acyl-phospholipid synthase